MSSPTTLQAAARPHSHGGKATALDATRATRLRSYDPGDFAVPTGREEDWRFTPLRRLRGLHDAAEADATVDVTVDAAPEVHVETVGHDDPRIGSVGMPGDRVAARAYAGFEKATVLTVGRDVTASRPSVVTVQGNGGMAFGHLHVALESHAQAVVVLDHRGSAAYAAGVELSLGDGAQLTFVSVQDWAGDAVHLSQHDLRVGRDAHVRHVVVTLGGNVVRLTPNVAYAGTGGSAELFGLYFADAGQHLEHRLFVDHEAPSCTSDVLYKGALQGADAHAVWVGDVLIRASAEGTQTYEMNRNLVLTEGARADSVPNLEIETGEIAGAGHASATGRFDDEQLFYLQSRGIRELEARRLVVRGFFADLLTRIGIPQLQERLLAAVEAELASALT